MVKAEQVRVGRDTGYYPHSQRDPADEAFPCVVYLLGNLISLVIPGDPLKAEGLALPSCLPAAACQGRGISALGRQPQRRIFG